MTRPDWSFAQYCDESLPASHLDEGKLTRFLGAAGLAAGLAGTSLPGLLSTRDKVSAPTPVAAPAPDTLTVLPPLAPRQTGPPVWSMSFLSFVMNAENEANQGWDAKKQKWFPYKSFEGGLRTIGYGHKFQTAAEQKKFKDGVTDAQAIAKLKDNLTKAWTDGRSFLKKTRGIDLETLPLASQEIVAEFILNVGVEGFGKFGEFTDALIAGNVAKMKEQYQRSAKSSKGKKVMLTRRNDLFAQRYLEPKLPVPLKSEPAPQVTAYRSAGTAPTR